MVGLGPKIYHLLWPVRHVDQLFPFLLLVGTLGVTICWLAGRFSLHRSRGRSWLEPMQPYGPFILFSLINYLSYVLLYHGHLSFPAWYYVVQPWLTALLLATIADKIDQIGHLLRWPGRTSFRWVILSGLGALWLIIFLVTIWRLEQWRVADQTGTRPQPLYEAADWVKANLAD